MSWSGTTVVAPLWQGSSRMTADEAAAGARRVAAALAGGPVVEVPAPSAPRGAFAVELMTSEIQLVLAGLGDGEPVLLVGGDCSADHALLRRALAGRRDVVWFDAHADANTPASSPSGAPHGMVARASLERDPDRLTYVGVRALDPGERRWIEEQDITVLPVDTAPADLLAEVDLLFDTHVHIDLDVLDPDEFSGVGFPEPRGMGVQRLVSLVDALVQPRRVRSLTICEHVPGSTPERDDATLALLADALA